MKTSLGMSSYFLSISRLIRFLAGLAAPLLIFSGQTTFAGESPSLNPADLVGKWSGEARHGNENADLGLIFEKKDDGRVFARVWLEQINAYGSPAGLINVTDGKFAISDFAAEFVQESDVLTGYFNGQDLTFQLKRTNRDFPAEPEPLWTYQGDDKFWASPVVDGNVVYIGDKKGIFHAVDVKSGRTKWTFDANSPLVGPAAVANGAVYFRRR